MLVTGIKGQPCNHAVTNVENDPLTMLALQGHPSFSNEVARTPLVLHAQMDLWSESLALPSWVVEQPIQITASHDLTFIDRDLAELWKPGKVLPQSIISLQYL